MPNFSMSLSTNVLYNEAIHMLQINMKFGELIKLTAMDLALMPPSIPFKVLLRKPSHRMWKVLADFSWNFITDK
ncbi:hypothetical protein VNO80_29794 [Phaseolus coccineus]|uniref:Uncharacterized protein n=1 Tax=Phaseolus coccineus TaxID=3886 RepID=A0AAN9QF78_PHACN